MCVSQAFDPAAEASRPQMGSAAAPAPAKEPALKEEAPQEEGKLPVVVLASVRTVLGTYGFWKIWVEPIYGDVASVGTGLGFLQWLSWSRSGSIVFMIVWPFVCTGL